MMSDKDIVDKVWDDLDERSFPDSVFPALLLVAKKVREDEAQRWMVKHGGEYDVGVRDERQRIIGEIMKHKECISYHEIEGEPATCLDMVLHELSVGCREDSKEARYACGHVGDTVLLDCNALSFAAYLEWKESFGFGGDRSLCFPCFCRKMREDSR